MSTMPVGVAGRRLLKLAGEANDLKRAAEVVAQSFLTEAYSPPTDLSSLFEKLRITKCEEADIAVNGELRRINRSYEIYYTGRQPISRRRFTIAHEIGHAILETTGPRCPQSGDEVERICDLLATCLLLPRRQYIEAIGSERSPRVILEAARIFNVSVMAAAFRFAAIFNASVFEVEDMRVVWGQGLVRKGYVTGDIKPFVESALRGHSGEEDAILNDGRSRIIRWAPLSYGKSALFTAVQLR